MTSRAQMPLVRGRSHSRKFDFFSFAVLTNVKRKKSVRRRNKKHSRTSPDVQFKEFSLTKQKTRPRTDYEMIGKTI